MIKLDYDDYDDLSREVFIENYVQHVEGRYGKRGNIMCITVPVEERDKSITVPVENVTRDSLWILVADVISSLLGRSTEWIFLHRMTQP